MKKFWLGVVISTFVGCLYFTYLSFSELGEFPNIADHYLFLIITLAASNVIGLLVYTSDQWLNKKLPWKEHLSARFIAGLLINSLLAIITIFLFGWALALIVNNGASLNELWNEHDAVAIKLFIITFLAVMIYSIIYFALFSYQQYAVVQIESIQSKRKQLLLQFEALRSQLSPHYLFNCLNTISSLIYKDSGLAEDFIRRLAETYQYILQNNEKRCVTLAQEVEFVRSYHYLLKVRFENNLHLDINLPSGILETQIPPLTLQMLVENAIKHNMITKERPLNIYIGAIDNTDIKVTNTKTVAPDNVRSFNIGLENIEKRYRYFTNRPVTIEDDKKFTVKLPVIDHQL
ncbi:MAG: histidine kinase, partial [Bacteroidota bacterium]